MTSEIRRLNRSNKEMWNKKYIYRVSEKNAPFKASLPSLNIKELVLLYYFKALEMAKGLIKEKEIGDGEIITEVGR